MGAEKTIYPNVLEGERQNDDNDVDIDTCNYDICILKEMNKNSIL